MFGVLFGKEITVWRLWVVQKGYKLWVIKYLQECCYMQQLQYLLQDSKMQEMTHPNTKTNGRWTKEEHLKFLEGLRIHGKNWKKIEQLVATRTGSQIRSHAQKFFLKPLHTEKKEENELQVPSDDPIEQLEEVTLNSKTVSESVMSQTQVSFYMDKIIKYWLNKQSFDFWTSLVDSKPKSSPRNQAAQNNSFRNYERRSGEGQQCKSRVLQPSF